MQTLLHAASLAIDLGADIVKLPLSGSVQDMTRVVELMFNSSARRRRNEVSDDEFGIFAANAMKSGARGLRPDAISSWQPIPRGRCARLGKF